MNFIYDEKKNQILFENRGLTFEQAIEIISEEGVLLDFQHPNAELYPNQRIVMETNYIDKQEKELIDSLKDLDLSQIKNDEENSKLLKKSAKAFVKKEETKMNIRISSSEFEKIKAAALQEGLK